MIKVYNIKPKAITKRKTVKTNKPTKIVTYSHNNPKEKRKRRGTKRKYIVKIENLNSTISNYVKSNYQVFLLDCLLSNFERPGT